MKGSSRHYTSSCHQAFVIHGWLSESCVPSENWDLSWQSPASKNLEVILINLAINLVNLINPWQGRSFLTVTVCCDCWVEWILWGSGGFLGRVDWTLIVLHSWVFTGRSGFDGHFITTSFVGAVFKGEGGVMQRVRGICGTVGRGINRVHYTSFVWILDALLYLRIDIILPGKNGKKYSLNKSHALLTFNTLTIKFCPIV